MKTAARNTPDTRAADARGPDRRRQARLAAVQALYQAEVAGASPQAVIAEFLQHRLKEEIDGLRLGRIDRALFSGIVTEVMREREDLDNMIAAVLDEDWTVDRLETLLRIILRCGAYELSERVDVPARPIISEYMDLAHAFFSGKEPSLVNGVLDKLARSLRDGELSGGPAAPSG